MATDASISRLTKAIEDSTRALKQQTKIIEVLNNNLVELAKIMRDGKPMTQAEFEKNLWASRPGMLPIKNHETDKGQ